VTACGVCGSNACGLASHQQILKARELDKKSRLGQELIMKEQREVRDEPELQRFEKQLAANYVLAKRADELQQQDNDLTNAEAFVKALEEDPSLYVV
jgi:hypothetical protein